MRVVFDLSTSARWSGHAVGIVRVERELARRALARSDLRIDFCVYAPWENGFRELSREEAIDIVEGRLQLHFTPLSRVAVQQTGPRAAVRRLLLETPGVYRVLQRLRGRRITSAELETIRALAGASPARSLRMRMRDAVLARPRLYQALQRLRGRAFTLDEIAKVRRVEAEPRAVRPIGAFVDQLAPRRLALTPDVLIVSCGLDWEHKNLRELYRVKENTQFRYAAVVYDLIPLIYPHYVVSGYVNLLTEYFGELFWVADIALSISENTQNDMLAYCADNGLSPPRAGHFSLGADLPPSGPVAAEIPTILEGKRFALFVSTIEPRKNHRIIYQAWERCLRERRVDGETCRIVFVGRKGWNIDNLVDEMSANPLTRESIVVLSNVSDDELELLYRAAEFTMFPSFYEGYGLPVAEALAHGKACLVSGAGSLPEVGGDLVTYCDPLDLAGWADGMARLFNDDAYRQAQSDRVAAAHRPITWSQAADAFFDKLTTLAAAP